MVLSHSHLGVNGGTREKNNRISWKSTPEVKLTDFTSFNSFVASESFSCFIQTI